jgi:hypothetical protein
MNQIKRFLESIEAEQDCLIEFDNNRCMIAHVPSVREVVDSSTD